jgi:hypothetical protein
MVFVKVPEHINYEDGVNRIEFKIIQSLFTKYNYKFSYFGHDTATFFDCTGIDSRGYVSGASRYCMDRRELAAFIQVLKKLEESEKRANELVMQLAVAKGMCW